MNDSCVYPYSFSEARRRNELERFNASMLLNQKCAGTLGQAIHEHLADGNSLRDGCAAAVLEQFGFKRVKFVLSNALQEMTDPMRIGEDAYEWFERIYVPPDEGYSRSYMVDVPAPLLEAFIAQTRQAYQALGLFGLEHCTGGRYELDYEGKVLVLSPDTLRESCWSLQNQLWYAHDGFGCSPHAIGRSIRATCLGDGEMTRWNRSDFVGVLDEQYLPDWAAEKLTELRCAEQKPSSGPAMGGMTMK